MNPISTGSLQAISIFILTILSFAGNSQNITQTLRGTIRDQISEAPLPGATIILQNVLPLKGAVTNQDGEFRISDVPVGVHSLKISFVGYKEKTLPNILVISGKETVLNTGLEENIILTDAAEVSAAIERDKSLNELSVVSSRQFSVEETQKYAAAVNDPSRMVSSFSGVQSTDDGSNQISIRGNSPHGLIYRMEGVEIPDPNHFSGVGASGGGISLLSSQLLSNSDFITGAFASEYGNALSGVFDLKLRKGNNEKREYTIQAGVLGVDLASEGPFSKEINGSYLINYRYSTLGVLSAMGVNIGSAQNIFQDLAFNNYISTKKIGVFTFFGFGGLSRSTSKAPMDSTKWANYWDRNNSKFYSDKGAVGLTHSCFLGKSTSIRTVLLQSKTALRYEEETLNSEYDAEMILDQSLFQDKTTFSPTLNAKLNSRHSLRTGIILNHFEYKLRFAKAFAPAAGLTDQINSKDNTQTIQAFAQWNYRLTEKFTINTGAHYLQLMLNNSWSVEPRGSIKYEMNDRHALSFGYGMHSQVQPLGVYFSKYNLRDGSSVKPNENLGLSKAHHFVLGYDILLAKNLHSKIEVYRQDLFNIPVSTNATSTLSILNNQGGFVVDSLTNKGKGQNQGVEFTLEKFLSNRSYFLLSTSFFDSKYKTLENEWRNTRFNANYTVALTAGKEFELSEKRKRRVIGINIKTLYSGGLRSTPIDVASSMEAGETVFREDLTYSQQNPDYFRTDIRISLKRNRAKLTETLSFDVQNVSNRKNFGGTYFDPLTGNTKTYTQTPLIPVLSYKLEF